MEACAKAASDAGAGGGGRGGVPLAAGSNTSGRDMGGALPQLEQALSRLGGGIWGAGDENSTAGSGPLSPSQLLGAGGAEEWGCVEAVLDQAAADKVDLGSVAVVMCARLFFFLFYNFFPFFVLLSLLCSYILRLAGRPWFRGGGDVCAPGRTTQHPEPCTPHLAPCTLNPALWTLDSEPYTLNPEPRAGRPWLRGGGDVCAISRDHSH